MAASSRNKRAASTEASMGRSQGWLPRQKDLYAWARAQAELLREGRVAEIDAAGVAEELKAMGREQYFKLESALRVLILHLLKWDRQPHLRGRSWALSIREQRRRIDRLLRDSPGLKPRLTAAIIDAYSRARDEAMRETRMGPEHFPPECPYPFEEIAQRPISVEGN